MYKSIRSTVLLIRNAWTLSKRARRYAWQAREVNNTRKFDNTIVLYICPYLSSDEPSVTDGKIRLRLRISILPEFHLCDEFPVRERMRFDIKERVVYFDPDLRRRGKWREYLESFRALIRCLSHARARRRRRRRATTSVVLLTAWLTPLHKSVSLRRVWSDERLRDFVWPEVVIREAFYLRVWALERKAEDETIAFKS